MISYGRQSISEEDFDAVRQVLASDFLTQGPQAPLFEQALKSLVEANYAVAVNSATSALHIACLALGVAEGDNVWTTPISFVASSNCAVMCGANVNFVDIDPVSRNLDVAALEFRLERASESGTLPKVVIPVHLAGDPCDMQKIHELAGKFGFKIIEDASHALGALLDGSPVGNCKYSDITIFSFHPVKMITTAEGGMATTNDAKLAENMCRLRSHGVVKDPSDFIYKQGKPWQYEQQILGFNYRMNDIQAALGVSQLSRISDFLQKRTNIVRNYLDAFRDLPLILPNSNSQNHSSWHLFIIEVLGSTEEKQRSDLFNHLLSWGISTNVHYEPIHLQPFYSKFGFKENDFPLAERYARRCLSLPLYPDLDENTQNRIIDAVTEFYQ